MVKMLTFHRISVIKLFLKKYIFSTANITEVYAEIQRGVDVNMKDDQELTALHYATENGK